MFQALIRRRVCICHIWVVFNFMNIRESNLSLTSFLWPKSVHRSCLPSHPSPAFFLVSSLCVHGLSARSYQVNVQIASPMIEFRRLELFSRSCFSCALPRGLNSWGVWTFAGCTGPVMPHRSSFTPKGRHSLCRTPKSLGEDCKRLATSVLGSAEQVRLAF